MIGRLLVFLLCTLLALLSNCTERQPHFPTGGLEGSKLQAPQLAGSVGIGAGVRPFGVAFQWPEIPGVIAFRLYRGTLPGASLAPYASIPKTQTRYKDIDVDEGTTYLYRLAAVHETPSGPVETLSRVIEVPVRTPLRVLSELVASYNARDITRFARTLAPDFRFQRLIDPDEYVSWGRDREVRIHEQFFDPSSTPPGATSIELSLGNLSLRRDGRDREGRPTWTVQCRARLIIDYARTSGSHVECEGPATFIVAEVQPNKWLITTWRDRYWEGTGS